MLAGSGVERDRLAQPDARITPLQQAAIVFNLLDATDDPSIAIEIGLRSSLTKAGLIGFGLMSCATLGEAISLGIRYLPTRVPFFSVRLAQLDGIVDIDVFEAFPLGRLRQFAVENFLVETAILFNSLLHPVPGRTLQSRAELHFSGRSRRGSSVIARGCRAVISTRARTASAAMPRCSTSRSAPRTRTPRR